MTSYRVIHVDCPCCETKFEAPILMSTNTFGGKTTDFHGRAVGFEPLNFYLGTCSTCGYTDYTYDIERTETLSEDIKRKVKAQIKPLIRPDMPDLDRRYEFVAWISEWRGDSAIKIADAYLKAAWIAKTPESAKHYRLRAIEWFKMVLQAPDETTDDPTTLTYLVGELYRRVDESAAANEWFNKAIAIAGDDARSKKMAEIARQQRDNPKEMF